MSKEILLTGANGFIGSNTAETLNARAFKGDITKVKNWEENLSGGEIILTLAGVRTETPVDFTINANSIDTLFKTAVRINKLPRKLILASSQAVYMGNEIPFKESQKPLPTTVYGESKLLGERKADEWCQKLNIPLVILRYSAVIGAGVREKSNMSGPLFAWTKVALAGEPITVFQDGKQSRDYIHIDDVVSANLMAADSLDPGIYNVGGGVSVRLQKLASWIKEFTKSTSDIIIMGGEPSQTDPKEMFSDTSKLFGMGWVLKKTAKEAVSEFVASRLLIST